MACDADVEALRARSRHPGSISVRLLRLSHRRRRALGWVCPIAKWRLAARPADRRADHGQPIRSL